MTARRRGVGWAPPGGRQRGVFAELDRVDIVFDDEEGRRIAVQTDHRDAAAQARTPALTELVAVLRVLAARRFDGVVYATLTEPAPFVRAAVEAAGARLRVGEDDWAPASTPDLAGTDRRVAAALDRLGQDVMARFALPIDRGGLERLEAEWASRELDRAGDPENFTTAWLELAGAAGVVMSAIHGGRWTRGEVFGEGVPYGWALEDRVSNVFGRAFTLVAEGLKPGPSAHLDALAEASSDDGPILPVIRPAGFGGEHATRSRPLVVVEGVEEIPHIYLIRDRSTSVEYIPTESEGDFDALYEASLYGLRKIRAKIERVDGLPCYFVQGDFYAASKVLDRGLIAGLSEALDSPMLLVAIPARIGAVVGASNHPETFASLVAELYESTSESQRVCPTIFVATPEDGVCGVLQADSAED